MEPGLNNEQGNIQTNNNIKEEINIKEQPEQPESKNINELKLNNINNKFDYFQNTKDNYDKLFIHEYIENLHLIENNQEMIDKKLNFLKLNKDLYDIKKPELDIKLQLKKQTKNLFLEELTNNNIQQENADSYFNLSPEAFEYNSNNKNKLYKSDGLLNIF